MTVEGAGRVVIWPGLQWAGMAMDSGSKTGNAVFRNSSDGERVSMCLPLSFWDGGKRRVILSVRMSRDSVACQWQHFNGP